MTDNYFSYVEGAIRFTYYPSLGKVACVNGLSFYRSIEHFAYRGFEVDWTRSNINTLNLFITAPSFLTEEEVLDLLSKSGQDLYNQKKHDDEVARNNLILNNIDGTTGLAIDEKKLIKKMDNLRLKTSKKDRFWVANWFGRFNIELARPDAPFILVSTKSKSIVLKEGRRIILGLFEKGMLRYLADEEYQEKLIKYGKGDDHQIEKEIEV